MGWKKLKNAYAIGHQVIVESGHICIGSGYVQNLAAINISTGKLVRNGTFSDFLERNYPELAAATPSELKALAQAPDEFEANITIFTFRDGDIIECLCEKPEYPNVTHDGRMIYESRFSTSIEEVVVWAKRDLEIWTRNLDERIEQLEKELAETRQKRQTTIEKAQTLSTTYPTLSLISGDTR